MIKKDSPAQKNTERWFTGGAWLVTAAILAFAVYMGWKSLVRPGQAAVAQPGDQKVPVVDLSLPAATNFSLPVFESSFGLVSITRETNLHTTIPTRPRHNTVLYTVLEGDSVFALAKEYGVKPETVLWANYDQLNDNPDFIIPGMELKIPPTDGVLYEWKEGDTLEVVASTFKANVNDILGWPGNELDLTNPKIPAGTVVMVPGGEREFRSWVVPTIPRGAAGVSTNLLGGGACTGSYDGAYGSGAFVWPADNQYLSGNDYWSGHLALDIAAGMGAAIYAADSGVVVFAGPAYGGYGNMIMIDHGNGYQTLYAHLSSVNTSCGASVYAGSFIGLSGSTGRSTGPHLHFEVRYMGGFINPWTVLP